jgi:hypothetical protein
VCRSKELGGRRCPSYNDPKATAAYNARRRELYALRKQAAASPEETSFAFPDLNSVKYDVCDELDPKYNQYIEEAADFFDTLHEDLRKFRDFIESDDADPDVDYYEQEEALETAVENQIRALGWYTASGFNAVRDAYHKKRLSPYKTVLTERDMEDVINYTPHIDAALAKAVPPAEPRVLYRGMLAPHELKQEDVGAWLEEKFPVGGVISQENYMSTSLSGYKAGNDFSENHSEMESFVFEIASKQGAVLGDETSSWGSMESEILMPRDAKFKVVSIHRNQDFTFRPTKESFSEEVTKKRTVIRLVDAS